MRNTFIAFGSILMLLIVGACSSGSDRAPVISCGDFGEERLLVQTMDVKVAQDFQFSLCSDPTNGYLWPPRAIVWDPAVVGGQSHNLVASTPPEEGEARVADLETWAFEAFAKGETTIELENLEPGNTRPRWTFELRVTVS